MNPDLIDQAQSLWRQFQAGGQSASGFSVPHVQESWVTPILLMVALLALIVLGKQLFVGTEADTADEEVKRPTNNPLWRRVWWKIKPPTDLMKIDGLAIDRSRRPHCAWLGATGAGKSSAVAVVRCDGGRVYAAVTPDLSDPLIAATKRVNGFHWTAGNPATAIDFMPKRRTPNEVAEYLTEVFQSGGVGAWKRKAYLATAEVVRQIDADDEPRSFALIAQRLKERCAKDRDLKLVCEGWIGRFESVAEKFGDSAGPHGEDLADLIGRNISVLLDNDAFRHPGLVEDVVALGLAEFKIIADELPNGFRLIFEEAGQLGDRIELAYPFFRAGRRRNIAVDVLTQAESDLKHHGNDAIPANLATRVYFAQEEEHLQKQAANRLGLDHSMLDPANLKDFHAFIAHGRIRRLVHFPKPPKAPRQRTYENLPTHLKPESPTPRRYVVEEIGTPAEPDYLALPLPRVEVQEVLSKIDRSQGDCWLWTGSIDDDGYAVQRWAYPDPTKKKNNRPAHQVVWEIANGRWFPVGEFDHRRTCPRRCVNPYHGSPTSKRDNIQRMHRTRGHITAAD